MALIWRIPDDYPEEHIGEYDRTVSPDRFLFRQGKLIDIGKNKPVVRFKAPMASLRKYGCLPSNTMVPLLSAEASETLRSLCGSNIQFVPSVVAATDGTLGDFALLNVLSLLPVIDLNKSVYSKVHGSDAILSFSHLVLCDNCLGSSHIARAAEYPSFLVVSAELANIFQEKGIRGVQFVAPEQVK